MQRVAKKKVSKKTNKKPGLKHMREIILDTETTGLDPTRGDKIVEIGCLELVNRLPSGETYHVYINPDRPMSPEAEAIHGISDAFLADKPKFGDIVDGFLAFIGNDPLVIHNASFDMKFINAELAHLGRDSLDDSPIIDTLAMARKRFPGAPASLDALCRRFGVDNSGRVHHGALLDSELLADVYLELSGGRQPGLVFQADAARASGAKGGPKAGSDGGPNADLNANGARHTQRRRPTPLAPRISEDERVAHRAFLDELPQTAVWLGPEQDKA